MCSKFVFDIDYRCTSNNIELHLLMSIVIFFFSIEFSKRQNPKLGITVVVMACKAPFPPFPSFPPLSMGKLSIGFS